MTTRTESLPCQRVARLVAVTRLPDPFTCELLDFYFQILQISSPSGGEEELRNFIIQKLQSISGVDCEVDSVGNLIVNLPPTDPDLPGIFLTAHLDNYLRKHTPMTPAINGIWMENLSSPVLGGDDKTGVAAMTLLFQEIAQGDIPHGPLRLILTVHEENLSIKGWSYGARKLSAGSLRGMDLGLAMDVPSGKSISHRNFLIYHFLENDPLLEQLRESAHMAGIHEPYMESEQKGFIGGDATTFYRNHRIRMVDFATGNYNEHTAAEATNLAEYLEQVTWLRTTYQLLSGKPWIRSK